MVPIAVQPDQGEGEQSCNQQKRFRVGCDDCSFDETTDGRENAKRIAEFHQRETEHGLVVVEWPQ